MVDLANHRYGCHILQKALDCEEDIRLLIVSELLIGDPAKTLINKHASHVWSKVCGDLYLVMTTGSGNPHGFRVRVRSGSGPGCLFGTRAKTRTRWPGVAGTGDFAGKYFQLLVLHFY
jgi:ribosomal protein L34